MVVACGGCSCSCWVGVGCDVGVGGKDILDFVQEIGGRRGGGGGGGGVLRWWVGCCQGVEQRRETQNEWYVACFRGRDVQGPLPFFNGGG